MWLRVARTSDYEHFSYIRHRLQLHEHFGSRPMCWRYSRDRIVVSTSRCGRDNPGSNPGHGRGCEVSIRLSQPFFSKKAHVLDKML